MIKTILLIVLGIGLTSSLWSQQSYVEESIKDQIALGPLSYVLRIDINSPETQLQISSTESTNLTISTTYLASTQEELKALAASSRLERKGTSIVLNLASGIPYSCSISRENGKITLIQGACVGSINLALPKRLKAQVFFNKTWKQGPFSTEDLLNGLNKQGFFKEKMELVSNYIKENPNEMETVDQVKEILKTSSVYDNERLQVLAIFCKRLSNPELGAQLVPLFSFSQAREQAAAMVTSPVK